eukprot:749927-Hanusia_phi.AAC.6
MSCRCKNTPPRHRRLTCGTWGTRPCWCGPAVLPGMSFEDIGEFLCDSCCLTEIQAEKQSPPLLPLPYQRVHIELFRQSSTILELRPTPSARYGFEAPQSEAVQDAELRWISPGQMIIANDLPISGY